MASIGVWTAPRRERSSKSALMRPTQLIHVSSRPRRRTARLRTLEEAPLARSKRPQGIGTATPGAETCSGLEYMSYELRAPSHTSLDAVRWLLSREWDC